MKTIDKISFIDCDSQPENSATYDFNTKVLKQGKATLSQKQINRIGFILATDLKAFAETGGCLSALSANAVYTYLQNNQ